MKDIVKRIAENAEKEFDAFKKEELLKTKEEIFNDNYKIRFYDEMYEFLGYAESLFDFKIRELRFIESEGTDFIRQIYDYFLGCEYASIASYDEITQMVHDYCEKYSD